jgi:hypothetical protein
MGLVERAKLELELQGLLSEEGDFYGGMTGNAVLELIEVFAKQGHSGGSAPAVVRLFSKLAMYEPLGPLTGNDEEWKEVNFGLDTLMYQNKRCTSVFKEANGTVTYNESVIKRCPNGATWTGPLYLTRDGAISGTDFIKVTVKGFPFTPKTFYIDVLEEEIAKDDWIMWVKDPKQLEEVGNYYNVEYIKK